MLGAAIPFQGTQSGTPDPNTTVTPGTTGTVIFRAKILDDYRTKPSPGADVVEGDVMTDTASMTAAVLAYSDALTPTGSTVTDGSQKSFTLANGGATKEVYMINGLAPVANQRVSPGDAVTFRLTYQLPFSSIKDYEIVDYLPLPIFDPTSDLTWNGQGPSNAAPAVGQWSFGPTDTFSQAPIAIPGVNNGNNPGNAVLNAGANSLTWDFGTFADPQDRPSVTDILFTVEATNKPFGDGLLLTNQGQQSERNQEGTLITSSPGIAQIVVAEPELTITKGVVSTDNANGEFTQNNTTGSSPPLPAGVTFSQPGAPGPSFIGTITSGPPAGLDATPIDATLSNVAGNDLVKFTIIVENTGSSPNGAFDVEISDTYDTTKFQIPTNSTGLNIQVTDGQGQPLPYAGDLFGSGIELIDGVSQHTGPGITVDWVDVGNNLIGVWSGSLNPTMPPYTRTYPTSLARELTFGSVSPPVAFEFAATRSGGTKTGYEWTDFSQQSSALGNGLFDFGLGSPFPPINTTGDQIYIEALGSSSLVARLAVPDGYISGSPLSGVMEVQGQSVANVFQNNLATPKEMFNDGTNTVTFQTVSPSSVTHGALGPGTFTDGTVINDGKNIAVITYDLQIRPDVAPLDVIPNTGTIKNYASTEGGPNFANNLTDDTNVTIQGPEITKTLEKTSIDDSFNSNTQAVIGEVATFKLDVGIPRGTTPGAVVVDTFPAGLAFKSIVPGTTVIDAGVSIANANWSTPVLSNDGKTLTFDLGDVTNSNASNDLKGFSIEYEAVVLNVASNKAGKTLKNAAELTWTSTAPVHSAGPAHSDPITVIEPEITVQKTVSPKNAEAGDSATFTINVTASGTTAHNVRLDDVLPAGLTATTGTLRASGTLPSNFQATAADTFHAIWNTLTPGQTGTMQFDVTVDRNVIPDQSITNVATAEWTSLKDPDQITTNNPNAYPRTGLGPNGKGELNNYTTDDAATLTIKKPLVSKKLLYTSIDNTRNTNEQAVIGETATYEIVVTIPQGETPDAVLKDRFTDLQLAYVSSTTPTISSSLNVQTPDPTPTLSQKFTKWDFGKIVNTDTDSTTPETITWQVTTLVLNVAQNIDGVPVKNDVQLRWDNNNSHTNWKKNEEVQVIEPKLTTTKTVQVGNLGGNPGDPVTYTIVIQQDAASSTDAFAATLTDVIPQEIASPVLTSVVDTEVPAQVTTGNFLLSGNTLTTITPFNVEKDSARTITLQIDGVLQGNFSANQVISNTSSIEWTSLGDSTHLIQDPNNPNSSNAYERTGKGTTGPGELNNYKDSDDAKFTVNTADLRVEKIVNDATPNVGDTITFTVTVTNFGPDTATGIQLTDTFPTQELQLDTAKIVPSPGTTYDAGTGIWDIGSLANGASVTLDLPAEVLHPTRPTPPSAQTNKAENLVVAEPDPNPGNESASATEKPKYADLEVHKVTDKYTPNVGEDVTYTITLFNNGPDTAKNVELRDTLPLNDVAFKSALAAPNTTYQTSGSPVTDVIWEVPEIQNQETLTLTIVVTATAPGLGANVITITGSETYDPILQNNTSLTLTKPQQADIAVDKVVDNLTPQVGENVTFTIDVTNNGPSTALAVEVADQLPAELTFVDSSRNDPLLPNYYNPATGVWTVGDMPNGASQTLTITATVLAPSSSTGPNSIISNTATGSTTTTDPNTGNDSSTAFVTPLQTDLAVFKAVSDATPNVTDTIEFAIAAANYGPAPATGVVVTDIIPAGLTYVGPSPIISPNPSDGSPVTYDSNTRTLTWNIDSLSAGATTAQQVPIFVYEVTVDAPSSGGIPPTLANSATITGNEHDPDLTNNTDSVSETPQYADLEVDKQVSNAAPNVDDVITYTITVTNNGKDDAENVELTDTLPTLPGLSIVGTPVPSTGSFDTVTGIWDIGTVHKNNFVTLSVQAKVLAPTSGIPLPQTNTATITGVTQYDPDPNNNSDSATETPQYADLDVEKIVDIAAPNVGDKVVFTITVTNLGKDKATNVKIEDLLPAGLTFLSADSLAYNEGTGVWNVGEVDVGVSNSKELKIRATVAASGTFTNEAEVSTTDKPVQFDPDPTNNKDSATVVTREADLLVTKTVDDPTPNVDDLITFTVDVTNNGPDIANNVEITDYFPTSGLTFVSATPSQGSYDDSTGIWSIGTIDNSVPTNKQTLTIKAYVDAPANNTVPQPHTNIAKVTKVDEHDPDPLNNIGEATETPKYADLLVEKISTNSQPNVGDTFFYTVTLSNLGLDTATNVEVTEFFPNNISVLSVVPTNTHTQSRWNLNQAGDGGVWSVPAIAPGMSEALMIQAQATSASVAYNTVLITHSDVWDPYKPNNIAQTPTDPQQADVVVTKTVDTPRPEVNAHVAFTITVENLGPTAAQNVEVTDLLPPGLEYVSASSSSFNFDPNTQIGTWDVGTLDPTNTKTLTITAKVLEPPAGSGFVLDSTNTATATSTTVDPNIGNNVGRATVDPLQADLAITKVASDIRPQIGTTFDYIIDVRNEGPDTATGVFVDDILPAGVTYQSDTSGGAYDASTGVWTIGPMLKDDQQTLTITVLVTMGNSGGTVANTASVDSGTWDPDKTNNEVTNLVVVPPRGIIVGTDIGCETGPYVRVIDPVTGADRFTPFFAYEPSFRGGVRVYGADVTGDGEPDVITAPGPGRPGEVRVWELINGHAVENTAYSFFPFGPSYTGGVEISEGSITAAGKIEIVAAQNLGGLVSVFEVTPTAANPVNTTPVRQLRPFGSSYLGGVTIETADIGTVNGSSVSSATPDGIMELFVGSGFGIQAQVRGYNGVTQSPTLFNSFNVMGSGYNRGVSVARLPSSTTNTADRILVSSGIDGNSQVETYNGRTSTRDDAFAAYSNSRAQVFSAAIDDDSIFNVQGLLGTQDGVQKALSPSGASKSTLPQSTVSYPPLRIAVLRN